MKNWKTPQELQNAALIVMKIFFGDLEFSTSFFFLNKKFGYVVVTEFEKKCFYFCFYLSSLKTNLLLYLNLSCFFEQYFLHFFNYTFLSNSTVT